MLDDRYMEEMKVIPPRRVFTRSNTPALIKSHEIDTLKSINHDQYSRKPQPSTVRRSGSILSLKVAEIHR